MGELPLTPLPEPLGPLILNGLDNVGSRTLVRRANPPPRHNIGSIIAFRGQIPRKPRIQHSTHPMSCGMKYGTKQHHNPPRLMPPYVGIYLAWVLSHADNSVTPISSRAFNRQPPIPNLRLRVLAVRLTCRSTIEPSLVHTTIRGMCFDAETRRPDNPHASSRRIPGCRLQKWQQALRE